MRRKRGSRGLSVCLMGWSDGVSEVRERFGGAYLAVVVNDRARGVFAADTAEQLHTLIRCACAVFGACSAISLRLWVADEIDMVFVDELTGLRKMHEHERAGVIADVKAMIDAL